MTIFLGLGFFGASAWADSIVLAGTQAVSGNGFGATTTALTIQSHGPGANSESGCISPGLSAGASACAPGDGAIGGNETSPIGSPKQAAPALSSLGINNANQLGILFDAAQPQNSSNKEVAINDLTLKLYNGSNLLYQASGTFSSLLANPGNGQSDYLFILDPHAIDAFNAALAGNLNDMVALDSTISFPNQSGGPDSYSLINLAGDPPSDPPTSDSAPTPEPGSLFLLGTALAGTGTVLRRRCLRVA
jgi:PEP-CTERM motif